MGMKAQGTWCVCFLMRLKARSATSLAVGFGDGGFWSRSGQAASFARCRAPRRSFIAGPAEKVHRLQPVQRDDVGPLRRFSELRFGNRASWLHGILSERSARNLSAAFQRMGIESVPFLRAPIGQEAGGAGAQSHGRARMSSICRDRWWESCGRDQATIVPSASTGEYAIGQMKSALEAVDFGSVFSRGRKKS